MSKRILNHIAESKKDYHKSRGKVPFEEKIKVIIELQKIDSEMRKNRKVRRPQYYKIWQIE